LSEKLDHDLTDLSHGDSPNGLWGCRIGLSKKVEGNKKTQPRGWVSGANGFVTAS